METIELAKKMLAWSDLRTQLDLLESEIKTEVLVIGKTQNVGPVRASYSGGRKTYNYQAAAEKLADENTLSRHTKLTYDWKSICEELDIQEIPFEQSPPSVTVKFVEA